MRRGPTIVCLALLAMAACSRRRSPTHDVSSTPAAATTDAAAAAREWQVVRVDRKPVAVFRGPGRIPAPAAVYDDGSILDVRHNPIGLARIDPSGRERWSIAWDGNMHVASVVATATDTWVGGFSDSRIEIPGYMKWVSTNHPIDTEPVLLRLDSASGKLAAASTLPDRPYGSALIFPSGDGVIAVSGTAQDTIVLLRLDRSFKIIKSGQIKGWSFRGAVPTQTGGVCLDVMKVPEPAGAGTLDGERLHWCFDENLKTLHQSDLPSGPFDAMLQDEKIDGHITQWSPHDYELHIAPTGRPEIVIESQCRVYDSMSVLEMFMLYDKDNQHPPVKLACDGTRVLVHDTLAGPEWRAFALSVDANVHIAGTPVEVAGDSFVLVKYGSDARLEVSVHAADDCEGPWRVGARHVAVRCQTRLELYDVRQ